MHLVFPAIPGNIGRIFSVGRDSGRSDSDRCSASDAEPESHKKTQQKIGQIRVKQRCVVFLFFSRGCGCFSGVVITDQYGRSNTKNNIRRLSSSFVFLMFLGISLWSWPATATLFGTGTQRYTNSNTEAITAPRHLKWRPPRKSWARKPQSHCCLCFICQVESWTWWKHLAQSADWLHDMIFDIQLHVRPWKWKGRIKVEMIQPIETTGVQSKWAKRMQTVRTSAEEKWDHRNSESNEHHTLKLTTNQTNQAK